MNPTTNLDLAYIAGGFLICGTLLGSWITYRFALAISKINNKIIAGNQLRSVFASALAEYELIYGKGMYEIDALLRRYLSAQATAIEVFRPFVAANKKTAYQEAWNNYHLPKGVIDSVFFREYTEEKIFKARVHAILNFTE